MILSLVTFAIIDAEAIANDIESPFIIGIERVGRFNPLLPSTRIRSGFSFNLSIEVVMARREARRLHRPGSLYSERRTRILRLPANRYSGPVLALSQSPGLFHQNELRRVGMLPRCQTVEVNTTRQI